MTVSKKLFTLVRKASDGAPRNFPPEITAVYCDTASPLVVIGAPGTGKTSLLIQAALSRIEGGQNPNSILLITYDRERASELRDAIALASSQTMFEPLARTFHSLAFSILKKKQGPNDLEPILLSGPEQEKFIRDLLVDDKKVNWPKDLEAAITTSGFVRELRDLMLRANERGLSFEELAKLGREKDEMYWPAAAHFWQRYTQAMIMREIGAGDSKERLDPSEIVSSATKRLRASPDLLSEMRSQFQTIMVDEFQESDPAQRELLALLAPSDLIITADGNSAVGRFRGADPDGLAAALDKYRGRSLTLTTSYRGNAHLLRISEGFARDKFSNTKTLERKPIDAKELIAAQIHRFRSQSEESAFIAHQFRSAHLQQGIAYSKMAVIIRNPGSMAGALRRAFAQVGIPVTSDLQVIAGNPAIAPLLLLAQIAVGKKLSLDLCEKLLLSEFGGADSISLRRIRRALIAGRTDGDERTGTELLISAIQDGEIFIEGGAPLERVHQLLKKARTTSRAKNARAEDLLWAIWDNAIASDGEKLSNTWRNQSLRKGSRGANADRDLDAMMQLFESAARYSERFPESKPDAFLHEITKEDIAGDVITAKGARPDYVEILTVHSAKGRQWEIVAVAGVQEGIWPNLKRRSSLLGAERLVEILRHPDIPHAQLNTIAANGLRADEERLFHVALSRANSYLFVTATSRDDDEPSEFFDSAETLINGFEASLIEKSEFTQIPRPITIPALVAELRSELNGERSELAASILKRLSNEGIMLADPNNWIGAIPISSNQSVITHDKLIPVSPSGLESFEECGLKWFLQSNGGTDGDSAAQVLGSAIHAFAAKMVEEPATTDADLQKALESSWKLINPESGWVSASDFENASRILGTFIRYHRETKRTILSVEQSFNVTIGRAQIRGSIDRIEIEADGSLFVIDFKTGQEAISQKKMPENLQLAAYQLGVIKGGLAKVTDSITTSGAELVYLAKETIKISKRTQGVINPDDFIDRISVIAEGMGAASFTATINNRCKGCPVRSSCPVQSDGRTVIQ